MSDGFGLKIGVDGEKEFKKAISDINTSFKNLNSEMKLAMSEFDKNEKSQESLTAKSKELNKQVDEQKNKIKTLENALQNASSSFGENDSRTQSWARQLNYAKADLNSMVKELAATDSELEKVGNEFNTAEKKADDFGDEIKRTGDFASDSGEKFNKLGSVATGIGVAVGAAMVAVGAAAITAGKSLVDATVETAAFADDMLTQSTITGMSTENLQAYSYAADLVDVSMETLTGSMAKNVKSMSNAAQGSEKYASAYAQLGISVTDANGNLRDSEDVYWETIDALGKVSNETERDALAMQLFGKSAQDLNPLIAQGSEGIAALTEEAHQMGAVLSEDSIEKLGQFDDSVQRLKQGSEATKRVIGTALLPQLQSLADDGTSLIAEFNTGILEANGDFGKISEVIGNAIGGISNMIMKQLPKIITVMGSIFSAIKDAILSNLPMLIVNGVNIIMSLLAGIVSALPQLVEGAVQLLLALVNGLIENLPLITESAIQVVVALATGIGEALPELMPAIYEAIVVMVQTLIENMPLLLNAAFLLMQGFVQGWKNSLPYMMDALPQLIISIVNFVAESLPQIVEVGIQILVALISGIIQAVPQLLAAIPQIIAAICEGFFKAVESVAKIGVEIVKGLWTGIKSMGTWINDKVTGFFSGIVKSVKGLLGIASPSKVFAQMGSFSGKGFLSGFSKSMEEAESVMGDAIPTDLNVDIGAAAAPSENAALLNGGTMLMPQIKLTQPLMIDGKMLTACISQILWENEQLIVRNAGV